MNIFKRVFPQGSVKNKNNTSPRHMTAPNQDITDEDMVIAPKSSKNNSGSGYNFFKVLSSTATKPANAVDDPMTELRLLASSLQQKLRVRASQLTRLSQEKEEINGKYQSLKMEYSLLQQDLEDARDMNKNLSDFSTRRGSSCSLQKSLIERKRQSVVKNVGSQDQEAIQFTHPSRMSSDRDNDCDMQKKYEELKCWYDQLVSEKLELEQTVVVLSRMLVKSDDDEQK